jgi:hypothetical protein
MSVQDKDICFVFINLEALHLQLLTNKKKGVIKTNFFT